MLSIVRADRCTATLGEIIAALTEEARYVSTDEHVAAALVSAALADLLSLEDNRRLARAMQAA